MAVVDERFKLAFGIATPTTIHQHKSIAMLGKVERTCMVCVRDVRREGKDDGCEVPTFGLQRISQLLQLIQLEVMCAT